MGSPCLKPRAIPAQASEHQYRDRSSTRQVERYSQQTTVREDRAVENNLENHFQHFAGIDWGSAQHRVCLIDRQGKVIQQRWFEHSGSGLAELAAWLPRRANQPPQSLAVAIEVPHGAIVETLLERGFPVFSINPRQLDRFRDRFSPAGAKDDSRDAQVLADSLRTDMHCFHPVRLDEPAMIRLRELSRLEDQIGEEFRRAANRLREQWHRFFPQLLQLVGAADEPWLWTLFEMAPDPASAARLTPAKIQRILTQHRIRRVQPAQILATLKTPPLCLAPGAAEAAAEHALLLLPHLRLLHQQRTHIARRVQTLLDEMAAHTGSQPDTAPDTQPQEHRDAAILLSLPGLGRKVAATMLSEAAQAIAERDYHALRSYSGAAPITQQSGKKKIVLMRRACNQRLRNALYYWAQKSTLNDPTSHNHYAQLRARGKSHGCALRIMAGRWLKILIAMLKSCTLFDKNQRASPALQAA
jgi:transposase